VVFDVAGAAADVTVERLGIPAAEVKTGPPWIWSIMRAGCGMIDASGKMMRRFSFGDRA
jgi:hypothetical protein